MQAFSAYADGNFTEEEMLRSRYRNSLEDAQRQGIHSITFSLPATGKYGCSPDEAMTLALEEIREFQGYEEMDIVLAVGDEENAGPDREFVRQLKQRIEQSRIPKFEEKESCASQGMSGASASANREAGRARFPLFGRKAAEKNSAVSDEIRFVDALPICELSMEAQKEPEECSEDAFRAELEERLSHRQDSFSEYLLYLIGKKGLTNAQVYKASLVDKKVFSKIKNNPDYHPQKLTALCLCVGAQLNIDETVDLLARAGYSLSPYYETDVIFRFFIERECYDMIDLDIMLEEMGLPCIVS